MRARLILPAFVLACALSACIAVPVVDNEPNTASCKTVTRSMSLKTVQVGANCHDEYCLAAVLTISAGSVLISGSIVLTGNTVHWLEYQGTCSDGYLNTIRQQFLKTIGRDHPESGPAALQRSLPAFGNSGIV